MNLRRTLAEFFQSQPFRAKCAELLREVCPMATASYTKLKSGDWGIRVPGTATPGQRVTVVTKAGASKQEVVGKVIWTGNGVSLCTVQSTTKSTAPKAGTCDECGAYSASRVSRTDSSGLRGMCCPRCAALPPHERSFG